MEPSSPTTEHAGSDRSRQQSWPPSQLCKVSAPISAAALMGKRGALRARSLGDGAGPHREAHSFGLSRFCPPIQMTLRMTTNLAGREVEPGDVMINGQE